MTTLLQWIEQEGAEGRRRLFEAIKAEYPKFTQVGLTNYIRGHRIPEFKVGDHFESHRNSHIPAVFPPYPQVQGVKLKLRGGGC